MYRVSIELQKHEWKFGRMRNAVETQATGECSHSFFEFSQTFTKCFYNAIQTRRTCFLPLLENIVIKKGKQLDVNFNYQI